MVKSRLGSRLKRIYSASRSSRGGQALVEFAFTSFVFFIIVFGTLDFGRAIYQYSQLHNAVREGARVAKVKPTDTAAIKAKIKDTGVGLDISDASIGVSGGGGKPGDVVRVTVSYHFDLITGDFLGITVPPLNASAAVEIE